jgi:dTDP-glucose 4,6-dehydratase
VAKADFRFLHVSTDEVYGSVNEGTSNENDSLLPNSPYAATKAAADLLVRSYVETYSMDIRITRCVNNYGPNQHPEKFLPMAITNIIEGKKISVYGQGMNIREWISVSDHCLAIESVLTQGKAGEIYNIGSGDRMSNLSVAKKVLEIMGLKISIKFWSEFPKIVNIFIPKSDKIKMTNRMPMRTFLKKSPLLDKGCGPIEDDPILFSIILYNNIIFDSFV